MSFIFIAKVLILYSFGFIVRFVLLQSSLSDSLSNRVEISTPISSWKRAIEGVSLLKQGINPYDSDIFHESPLGLFTYSYILNEVPNWMPFIFSICDLLTATLLALSARIYLRKLVQNEKLLPVPESTKNLVLVQDDIQWIPFCIAAVYLLCPYSIASCGGKSTATFLNLVLALHVFLTVAGQWFLSSVVLAALSFHSLYYIVLIVPLLMHICPDDFSQSKVCNVLRLVFTVVTLFAALGGLFYTFFTVLGSWDFAKNTYGCILSVPDLTPNIGLFWYFFTEMFEHFRVFFLCTFQLNVFLYTVPLSIRLRKDPIFLLFIHICIITIFKSYPCIGDLAFYLALLPMWSHLQYYMRQGFVIGCVLVICTLLAPTLWHLWIYSGSANANFYFAITLAFNTGQVFLLTDILSAYIKREYYLENGVKYNEEGLVLLRLQDIGSSKTCKS